MKNNKILGLIGLSARARKVSFGADSTEEDIKKRKAKLVIVAEDGSERTKNKYIDLCQKYNIPILIFSNIENISKAIGKENKAIIGIKEVNIAKQIQKIYYRG